MPKQPTLSDISNILTSATALNANWDAIQTAFQNTLSRDGSGPNQMLSDLDLNGNDLLNVGSLTATEIRIGGQDMVAVLTALVASSQAASAASAASASAASTQASAAGASAASAASALAQALTARDNTVTASNLTVGAVSTAQAAATAADIARIQAQAARTGVETAQTAAQTARDQAQLAQSNAEVAAANAAQDVATILEANVAASAADAEDSANAAQSSASAAASSAASASANLPTIVTSSRSYTLPITFEYDGFLNNSRDPVLRLKTVRVQDAITVQGKITLTLTGGDTPGSVPTTLPTYLSLNLVDLLAQDSLTIPQISGDAYGVGYITYLNNGASVGLPTPISVELDAASELLTLRGEVFDSINNAVQTYNTIVFNFNILFEQ